MTFLQSIRFLYHGVKAAWRTWRGDPRPMRDDEQYIVEEIAAMQLGKHEDHNDVIYRARRELRIREEEADY